MPRITPERRQARRDQILVAARRRFSRDGFHQTSMPDIAAEAGLSTGAPYRHFASKEDIILEIAGQAFQTMFQPLLALSEDSPPASVADLVAAAVAPMSGELTPQAAGPPVSVDELLRCGVQIWAELLRHDGMRERAQQGFDGVRERMADALRRGQRAGTVPAELDADRATRVVMALLHGFVLQRAAFELSDVEGFVHDVRTVLRNP